MRYLGGKFRTCKRIALYLNGIREPEQPYWEPFVGSGWVLSRIRGQPNYASDLCNPLIDMWGDLQGGWIPPKIVTEKDYQRAKDGRLDNALMAFIGFGCSWGGKWFGGYAKGEGRNWAKEASDSLLRKIARAPPTTFFCADFLFCPIPARNCLIYCDPPYRGTTGYDAIGNWQPDLFWRRVRRLEEFGHTIVVSEYQAPPDFSCVLEMPTKTDLRAKETHRVERLFRHGRHRLEGQLSLGGI